MNICVLKLEKNKYFVGSTNFIYPNDVLTYFKQNTNYWLDSYPIIKVNNIIPIQYFSNTKNEKDIELYYEVKKIMKVLISRFSIENVLSEINISQENKSVLSKIPIQPGEKSITNSFTSEQEWYEELERQEKASSFGMYSSSCFAELYKDTNFNLEWNEEIEKVPQSPFEIFYSNN